MSSDTQLYRAWCIVTWQWKNFEIRSFTLVTPTWYTANWVCWSELCRGACKDPGNFNHLARSLVIASVSCSGGHEFESLVGQNLHVSQSENWRLLGWGLLNCSDFNDSRGSRASCFSIFLARENNIKHFMSTSLQIWLQSYKRVLVWPTKVSLKINFVKRRIQFLETNQNNFNNFNAKTLINSYKSGVPRRPGPE